VQCSNQPSPSHNSSANPTSSIPPLKNILTLKPSTLAPAQPTIENTQDKNTSITDPPIHPFANTKEMVYCPPQDKNFALQPKPPKEKDFAYKTYAPIQDSKMADLVYSCAMKDSHFTISLQELLLLSPEVQQKVMDAVTPKRIATGEKYLLYQDALLYMADEEDTLVKITTHSDSLPPGSIIIPDPFKSYLNLLPTGSNAESFYITKDSTALQSVYLNINNQDSTESVIDPSSEIIVMSEEICHNLTTLPFT
jgi:hypothetical protein